MPIISKRSNSSSTYGLFLDNLAPFLWCHGNASLVVVDHFVCPFADYCQHRDDHLMDRVHDSVVARDSSRAVASLVAFQAVRQSCSD